MPADCGLGEEGMSPKSEAKKTPSATLMDSRGEWWRPSTGWGRSASCEEWAAWGTVYAAINLQDASLAKVMEITLRFGKQTRKLPTCSVCGVTPPAEEPVPCAARPALSSSHLFPL